VTGAGVAGIKIVQAAALRTSQEDPSQEIKKIRHKRLNSGLLSASCFLTRETGLSPAEIKGAARRGASLSRISAEGWV
jgi:hypothetical protein